MTLHVSADDGDNYVPMTLELVFANLRRYLADEELMNRVRPDWATSAHSTGGQNDDRTTTDNG